MNQKNISELFATFFYVGKFPKAPGTAGTLATIPLWVFLAYYFHAVWYMVIVFLILLFGIYICQIYENYSEKHDSKEIVIDEVVGYLITMTWLPLTWQSCVLGFVLFRILDILKPPPIRQLDQKVKGGVGVMIDDVAAGIIANLVLQLIYTHTNWFGVQVITI
jgi:phosphatidylglycerophosphatase A